MPIVNKVNKDMKKDVKNQPENMKKEDIKEKEEKEEKEEEEEQNSDVNEDEKEDVKEEEENDSDDEDSEKKKAKKKRIPYKDEDFESLPKVFEKHKKDTIQLCHAYQDLLTKYHKTVAKLNVYEGKRKARSDKAKQNDNSYLLKKYTLSDDMKDFLGMTKSDNTQYSITELVKGVNRYIDDNNKSGNLKGKKIIKDVINKKTKKSEHKEVIDNSYIYLDKDPKLAKLFPNVGEMKIIQLGKLLKNHVIFEEK
jgi:chromatin remodeling complex protein RSC6